VYKMWDFFEKYHLIQKHAGELKQKNVKQPKNYILIAGVMSVLSVFVIGFLFLQKAPESKQAVAEKEVKQESVVTTSQPQPETVTSPWEKPWASVKDAAKLRCAKIFEDFQLQAVCMENEQKGYNKMQDDFGMPSAVAKKAKERCERTFKDFQLQAVCMENEKKGYDKMNS